MVRKACWRFLIGKKSTFSRQMTTWTDLGWGFLEEQTQYGRPKVGHKVVGQQVALMGKRYIDILSIP